MTASRSSCVRTGFHARLASQPETQRGTKGPRARIATAPCISKTLSAARRRPKESDVVKSTDLDKYRGMADQKATEMRRRQQTVKDDQSVLRQRRDEMERHLFAASAGGWPEAVDKARYLLMLYAHSAADPRIRTMVDAVLADFEGLLSEMPVGPANADDRPKKGS
jgi:hypothetical protein